MYTDNVQTSKDLEQWLTEIPKHKFSKVETTSYKNGDIEIIEPQGDHINGHAQSYKDGKWFSDYEQKSQDPWENC